MLMDKKQICSMCCKRDGDNHMTRKESKNAKRVAKRRERQAWLDDWDGEW